jgi:HSP20 family protein
MENYDKNETAKGAIRITSRVVNLKLRVHPHAWHPATDLFETEKEYIIKVEIAGVSEEDITVSLDKNIISIYGQRPLVSPDGAFHRLEIPYGDFSSIVEIPQEIDPHKVEAFYKNGFLTVKMPKAAPVNIEIK